MEKSRAVTMEFRLTLRVRKILKDPGSEGFLTIASLILSHRNDPKTMWKDYMDPAVFYKHWPSIKENMLRHNWGADKIPAWQAVYEEMGGKERPVQRAHYRTIGNRLAVLRCKAGMSQQELAGKLRTSQQFVSRIEKGDENITLATLFNIARVLKIGVKIDLGRR